MNNDILIQQFLLLAELVKNNMTKDASNIENLTPVENTPKLVVEKETSTINEPAAVKVPDEILNLDELFHIQENFVETTPVVNETIILCSEIPETASPKLTIRENIYQTDDAELAKLSYVFDAETYISLKDWQNIENLITKLKEQRKTDSAYIGHLKSKIKKLTAEKNDQEIIITDVKERNRKTMNRLHYCRDYTKKLDEMLNLDFNKDESEEEESEDEPASKKKKNDIDYKPVIDETCSSDDEISIRKPDVKAKKSKKTKSLIEQTKPKLPKKNDQADKWYKCAQLINGVNCKYAEKTTTHNFKRHNEKFHNALKVPPTIIDFNNIEFQDD